MNAPDIAWVSAAYAHEQVKAHGANLIDVRTSSEFNGAHAQAARNIPLGELTAEVVQTTCDWRLDEPVFVICEAGGRAAKACATLARAGAAHVANVEGGTQAWMKAGLPTVYGKQTLSIDRQVRLLAGAAVLLSAVLGYLVNPQFIALAAFVGAGLIIAGTTNTCGLALALRKMPWNRGA